VEIVSRTSLGKLGAKNREQIIKAHNGRINSGEEGSIPKRRDVGNQAGVEGVKD
jgi:hypothetical protein